MVFEWSLDRLDNSISELRKIANNLMPESLSKLGLSAALRDLCDTINSRNSIKLSFQVVGQTLRLDSSLEAVVYRVVQELVNNILKHAHAQNALVQVMFESRSIGITVEDDGLGFEKSQLEKKQDGGWSNIRSRVEYLKGSVDLAAQPGEGTSVYIRLPVS
jgi:two-component system, NarL family, sensor kinase